MDAVLPSPAPASKAAGAAWSALTHSGAFPAPCRAVQFFRYPASCHLPLRIRPVSRARLSSESICPLRPMYGTPGGSPSGDRIRPRRTGRTGSHGSRRSSSSRRARFSAGNRVLTHPDLSVPRAGPHNRSAVSTSAVQVPSDGIQVTRVSSRSTLSRSLEELSVAVAEAPQMGFSKISNIRRLPQCGVAARGSVYCAAAAGIRFRFHSPGSVRRPDQIRFRRREKTDSGRHLLLGGLRSI